MIFHTNVGTANLYGSKTSSPSKDSVASSGKRSQLKIEKRNASASTLTMEHAAVSSVMYPQRHSSIGTLRGKQSFIRPISHSTKRKFPQRSDFSDEPDEAFVRPPIDDAISSNDDDDESDEEEPLKFTRPQPSQFIGAQQSNRLLNGRVLPLSTTNRC